MAADYRLLCWRTVQLRLSFLDVVLSGLETCGRTKVSFSPRTDMSAASCTLTSSAQLRRITLRTSYRTGRASFSGRRSDLRDNHPRIEVGWLCRHPCGPRYPTQTCGYGPSGRGGAREFGHYRQTGWSINSWSFRVCFPLNCVVKRCNPSGSTSLRISSPLSNRSRQSSSSVWTGLRFCDNPE